MYISECISSNRVKNYQNIEQIKNRFRKIYTKYVLSIYFGTEWIYEMCTVYGNKYDCVYVLGYKLFTL